VIIIVYRIIRILKIDSHFFAKVIMKRQVAASDFLDKTAVS